MGNWLIVCNYWVRIYPILIPYRDYEVVDFGEVLKCSAENDESREKFVLT